MPAAKRQRQEEEDEDYDEIESIGTDSSVHTSDEEEDDDASSGDEIAKATVAKPTKTLYYRYISTDPIPKGTERYSVVREGPLHIGLPTPSDPLPAKAELYTILHDKPSNEYVSALKVKEDTAATIVRYFVLSNQTTWTAQMRKLLPSTKLSMTVIANLSLAVHGLHGDTAYDKELLEHQDLANFRINDEFGGHLLDTPHAKKLIEKAKKATAKAAKRRADSEAAGSPSKKKKAAKKKVVSAPTVTEEDDAAAGSPLKTGSTPSKAPAVKAKPKGEGATKAKPPRQLKLGAVAKVGPAVPSPRPAGKQAAKSAARVALRSKVPAFQSVLPAVRALLDHLGVDVEACK